MLNANTSQASHPLLFSICTRFRPVRFCSALDTLLFPNLTAIDRFQLAVSANDASTFATVQHLCLYNYVFFSIYLPFQKLLPNLQTVTMNRQARWFGSELMKQEATFLVSLQNILEEQDEKGYKWEMPTVNFLCRGAGPVHRPATEPFSELTT